MSKQQQIKKWIVAVKILGEDPSRIVICPNCNIGHLYIKDVVVEKEKKCDRYFICPKCKAYNTVTFFID